MYEWFSPAVTQHSVIMLAPGRLHVGCRVGHWPTPAFGPARPQSIRRSRAHVAVCALFKQVITDQQQLAKQASKYGLVVTELKDIDVVDSVAEVQRVAGKIKGLSSNQAQQQATEVVHPPVQVTPAPMAAPTWLLPGILGAGAAAAVGFLAVKSMRVATPTATAHLPLTTAAAPAPGAVTPAARAAAAASAAAVVRPPAAAKPVAVPPVVNRPATSSSSGGRPGTPAVPRAPAAPSPAGRTAATARPPSQLAAAAAASTSTKVAAPAPATARPGTLVKPSTTTAAVKVAAPVAAPLAAVQARAPSPLLPPGVLTSSQAGASALAAAEAAMASEAAASAAAAEEVLQPLSSKAGQLLDKMSAVFSALDPQAAEKAAAAQAAASAAALAASKAGLLDLLYTTGRGLGASPEQRAEVEERVTALEAASPARSARLALAQLSGTWKLLYTNHTPTLLVLNALHSLPLADLGEVYQVVDAEQLTAYNQIDLALPWMLSLTARSPLAPGPSGRSLRLGFSHVGLHTHIHTPQLLAALTVPDQVSVMGATLDLKPLQRLLDQVNTSAASAQQLVDTWVSTPTFPVAPAAAEPAALWLLTTYLDDTLRISRDANGRVFVMVKDIRLPEEEEGGAAAAAPAAAGGENVAGAATA